MRSIRSAVAHGLGPRIRAGLVALFLLTVGALPAASQEVRIVTEPDGTRLQVDGEDFMVLGMNWDYFPRGTTYSYNFWGQPDALIQAALDREMGLMQTMGANTIRVYNGIPPRWVEYIYDTYGIYSVVNHAVGRYGVDLTGRYVPNTDYSDPATRAQLIGEVRALVEEFQGTRGVLMWLLGNENNYGLVWSSAETEDLPVGEADAVRARYLYSLFGEVVDAIKEIDTERPVAMANGDLQYLDIIAEEVDNLDIFGSNVYRGISFGDLFQRVKDTMGIPVVFTEFGADRFDAIRMREDQETQAKYLIGQWQEIYEQSAGKGRVGNAIGGMTFQWTDGWWKFGQEDRLDIQDTNASWSNDAYPEDWEPGENNMNEEWWGVVAKGPTDPYGLYELYPRAAFYALKQAYELDPYAPGTDLEAIREHFSRITPADAAVAATGSTAALASGSAATAFFRGLRMEFETYSTGGDLISTPESRGNDASQYPSFQGFDQKQSFYVDFGARPQPNLEANLAVNILGSVPENPIDEIFYENRGRSTRFETVDGRTVEVADFERVRIHSANVTWDARNFQLDAFYRTGHYHWGYEGDFFGLYREANYGPNIDVYGGVAPVGVEIAGKRGFDGLKLAVGPELWWGANPTALLKYETRLAGFDVAGIVQEDFARQSAIASSFAVPTPKNRAATLYLSRDVGGMGVELGGIWSGSKRVGQAFQVLGDDGTVLQDFVKDEDTFGGRARISMSRGAINWYAQGAAMGLVADGGPTQIQTFTGWRLADSGMGNQWNLMSGFTYNTGSWQIAPNVLWQKPIVGPMPSDVAAPGRPRNILDDPFSVRANRETTAAELLITYDPTPATWMYAWDSDIREDAPLAASVGFVFKHHPTTQDAGIGILPDGRTAFAFPGAPPAEDLWEIHTRVVSKRVAGVGLILNAFAGTGQANGDSPRTIERYGADLRAALGSTRLQAGAKFNDWGPYDYHRDFNLTFPVQLMTDLSYSFGLPDWFNTPQTRFGVRGAWRSLDRFSPRYCPAQVAGERGTLVCDPLAPGANGSEWEIRTYLHFVL